MLIRTTCFAGGSGASTPQRRRVIVLGANDAGLAIADHLGWSAMLIDQRGGGDDPAAQREALYAAAIEPGFVPFIAGLKPFTQAELRFGARVTAIHTLDHHLHLSTGESFVYDKLVSALSIPKLMELILDETPGRVRGGEWWSYWLNCRDIEFLDEEEDGTRLGEHIRREMAAKYQYKSLGKTAALFQPRVVSG